MADFPFTLRSLPAAARIGVSCLVLVTIGGFVASGRHLVEHHQNRDEKPGLSMDDLRGAYHGVRTTAPLRTALQRDHPADITDDASLHISDDERRILLDWLNGDRISEDYDNLDLGDAAPAEILAGTCLECHARQATLGDGVGERVPLDYWDDVKKVAFSREIHPTDIKILTTSTHTHALSLATLSLVVAGLAFATRWPRTAVNGAIAVMGVTLLADIAAWWLARPRVELVWVIAAAGGLYSVTMVVTLLAILVDMWRPAASRSSGP